jgi:Kdo2-lipid IVA lauroyltransferase/acyltransferase
MAWLKNILEYGGALFALYIVDHLPLMRAEALARRLARGWFRVAGTRRRIAIDNLLAAHITADPAAARRIARTSFEHFGVVLVESLKSGQIFNEHNWREKVELDLAPEAVSALEEPGRGLILVSGHFGSWELAAQILSYFKPVVGITRRMNNPLADGLVQRRKPRNRFTLTPKHDADIGRLLGVLRRGDVLAMMVDQHAPVRGMQVPFFGRPASTYVSAPLLHLVTGAPIVFGYCVRLAPFRYRIVAHPPLTYTPSGDKEADIRGILTEINRRLEAVVRAYPDQYLWAHRRWR